MRSNPHLDNLVDRVGLWAQHRAEPNRFSGRAAVFLDRDGVIVEEIGYLGHPDDVRIVAGAAAVIADLNRRNIPVIVVTNQAGIAYGYYGWDSFCAVQERIVAELTLVGAHLDMVLACGYGERGILSLVAQNHPWRKPNPGMLLHAAEVLGIALVDSVIIGDKVSDLEAGCRAGLKIGVLVHTGHGSNEASKLTGVASANFKVGAAADLKEALSAYLCDDAA